MLFRSQGDEAPRRVGANGDEEAIAGARERVRRDVGRDHVRRRDEPRRRDRHGDRNVFMAPAALTVFVWVLLMNSMDFLPVDLPSFVLHATGLDHAGGCITGPELEAMDDAELARRIPTVSVFAMKRTNPSIRSST